MILAGMAAVAVGLAASVDSKAAVLIALGAAIATALALRPGLLPATLIVSVFIEIVSIGGVTVSRLLAPVALVMTFLALLRGRRMGIAAPVLWALSYAMWALASSFWTASFRSTMFQLASLAIALIYMMAFATFVSRPEDVERILYAVTITSVAVGLFAIVGFFLALPQELEAGRTSGGTGDPNFFAAYQLVALPLVLVLAGRARSPQIRLVLYGAVCVVVASVFTSVSRGGLLTLAVFGLLFLVLPSRAILHSGRQKAAVLAVLLLGTVIAYGATGSELSSRIDSVFSSDRSGSGRLNDWRAAWHSVHERPFLGIGYGAFVPSSNDLLRRTPGVDLVHYDLRGSGEAVHSAYLGTAAELGVPGVVFLSGLLFSAAHLLRRTARRAQREADPLIARTANALFLSLAAWSVASIFLSSETSRSLWIIVGLSLALPKLLSAGSPQDST